MSLLYESGTSTSHQTGSAGAVTFSNNGNLRLDGIGVARFSSQGINQSLIAKKCAPPSKPTARALYSILFGFLCLVFGWMWQLGAMDDGEGLSKVALMFFIMGALLLTVITMLMIRSDYRARKKHKFDYLVWKNSWICLRCGEAWKCQ
jgi:hypothetical protein